MTQSEVRGAVPSVFQAKFGAKMLKTTGDGSYVRLHSSRKEKSRPQPGGEGSVPITPNPPIGGNQQRTEGFPEDKPAAATAGGGTIHVTRAFSLLSSPPRRQPHEQLAPAPSHIARAGHYIAGGTTPQHAPILLQHHQHYQQHQQYFFQQQPPVHSMSQAAQQGGNAYHPHGANNGTWQFQTHQNVAASGQDQQPPHQYEGHAYRPGLADLERAMAEVDVNSAQLGQHPLQAQSSSGQRGDFGLQRGQFHEQARQQERNPAQGPPRYPEETWNSQSGPRDRVSHHQRQPRQDQMRAPPSPPPSPEQPSEPVVLTREKRNERLIKTEADQLVYSRKHRPVKFKPCTTKEYLKEKPKEYFELGKLQADLDTEEMAQKREKLARMKAYAASLRAMNATNTAGSSPAGSQGYRSSGAKPARAANSEVCFGARQVYSGRQHGAGRPGPSETPLQAQRRKAQSARQRGIEFAKGVPRPRVKTCPAPAPAAEADFAAESADMHRGAAGGEGGSRASSEARPVSELDKLSQNHERARDEIDRIRRELGMH